MEKLMYLLHKPDASSVESFREVLCDELVTGLRERGASQITLNIADLNDELAARAPGRLIGPWQAVSAAVAFWHDYADAAASAVAEPLAQCSQRADGYLVTESVPQPFTPDWGGGKRRPGITQFGANAAPAGISDADFFRNWQQHSDSSFDLHPLRWSYVRNAVLRPLTESAPNYRCIVAEHFHSPDDFLDDERYFGSAEAVATMLEEVAGFCDFENMFSLGMSEYYFA